MVLETVNGIKLGESKVADLVDPSTIRFSSRISNNRICVHFSEKEAFDKSTSSHKSITIRGYTIQVRSLISRAKRIIISNACPTIPNEDIQDSLVKLDIRLKSEPHSSESEVTTSGRPMLAIDGRSTLTRNTCKMTQNPFSYPLKVKRETFY